jgi:hypothetical protein
VQLKRRGILLLAIVGLLSISGLALAQAGDDTGNENDTVFNFGYIEEDQFLMWNVSSINYEVDDGPDYDELVELCSLQGPEEEQFVYDYTVDAEGNITLDPQGDAIPLDEEFCGKVFGDLVSGPAGQVNHGMFMKLFNSVYEGKNRGCLVRHLAQSDLGKGDQQVIVDDVDPDFEFDGEGEVSFTTVETDCQHGAKAEDDSNGGGPPDFVRQKFEDGGPGRSGNGHGPPWKNN